MMEQRITVDELWLSEVNGISDWWWDIEDRWEEDGEVEEVKVELGAYLALCVATLPTSDPSGSGG